MLIDFVCVYVCTGDGFHGTCVAVRRQLLGAQVLSGLVAGAFPAEPSPAIYCLTVCACTHAFLLRCPFSLPSPTSARLQQVSLLLASLSSLHSTDLTRVTCENGQRVGIDTTGKNGLFVVVYFLYSYFKAFGIYPDVWYKLVTPTQLTEDPIFPLI